MTQKLALSFINPDPFSIKKWSWISGLLLCASVFILAEIGVLYLNQLQSIATLQEKLDRLQMSRSQTKADATRTKNSYSEIKLSAAQKKQINETISELVVDWDALFQAIENTLLEDIALLEISPNSKKKLIVIRGEAKTLKAVFAYIKALDETPNLSKVYLQTHSVDDANVSKPVSFTLSAEWQRNATHEKQQ